MVTAEATARVPGGAWASPATAIARLTVRKAVRSGAIWGYIFGAAIASSAFSYARIYKTPAQREALAAAYGSNQATSALFGPAPQLQTVAGFTVFKISMTLLLLGAVWGLLTSTRLLRGEEDSGRWEILLAGQTTRSRAAAQALGGLGAGCFVLWAVTGLLTVLVGLDRDVSFTAGASLYFALAMVTTAVMFLAVGALTSQLAPTRRQAAAYAASFLGACYAVRMIADAGLGLHGLIWASPLGWAEELQPLTGPQPLALIPVAVFTLAAGAAAVWLAGLRDTGTGIVADRAVSRPRLWLLNGPAGLAVRLVRPAVAGWWVAIAVSGLLFGLIARSASGTISGSSVGSVLARLGAPGAGATAVLGVCFLVLAVLVAFMAAGQITAARAEESGGQLDHLLARPVSRSRWLAGRLTVAVAALVAGGLAAGAFAWLGAASQHAGVSFTALVAAGLNTVPPALVVLGIGTLAFGVWPRATSGAAYLVLTWSLLAVLIGSVGTTSTLVLGTSVWHYMASAPATSPNWAANAVMTAIGAVAALAGGLALHRRDLQGA